MLLGLTPLLLANMSANGWRTAQLRLPSNAWYNRQHTQLSFSHSLMIHAILVGAPLFFFWNVQDQKVHRYVGSSQLGTSRNQPLCSTPEIHAILVGAPLSDEDVASPSWCKAWRRAAHKRLPRSTRVFAWRLLHAALPCGGATVVFFPPGDPALSNARCSNLGCPTLPLRPLETLHHLFFECAPCHRALEWLCHLWGLIDPEHPAPPMLPHVLLADDQATWAPPQQLSSPWNLLRLTMLKRIWIGRCAAVAAGDGPSQASTPAIVCAFIREIRSLMQQDWLRVEGDVRQLGGVCPSWFRGRDPSLPLQRFQSWWCAEDVLASTQLVVGGQPRMVLKLSRFSVPGLPL